ncbi:developmental pluripotency-associated 5 protein-like [Mustela lutreola]|uniref:developmental pluripotency-associated 5 protein-like n=1 Tax=Mustela lutreola TaxID=9666 RepID=UPI002796E8B8|nr:developmental pluripotency-associated 5 protein-like [Mustela lutreola]
MGMLPERKDIPPWVEGSEDLKDPEVLQVQTQPLEALLGPAGSQILYSKRVSKVTLELKVLEPLDFTEVVIYGCYLCKRRAGWVLRSVAQWHRQRQE